MFLDIDVRAILPTINVPTLVLHRRGDRVVNWRAGRTRLADPECKVVDFPVSTTCRGLAIRIRSSGRSRSSSPERDRCLSG